MHPEELEALADRVYAAYEVLPEADGLRVDPTLLAEKLLGLKVVYRRLSRDGSILGLTAPAPVAVPVLEDGLRWYALDGRTILLERGLLSPWVTPGRRNFTLMHEVGHRLLGLGGEAPANRLASALLMPRSLLRRRLAACIWRSGPLPDRRLDPDRWEAFCRLAETLGVSRQALAIRMEGLGLTELRQGWILRPTPVLVPGAGEWEDERCRDTTRERGTPSATPEHRPSRAS